MTFTYDPGIRWLCGEMILGGENTIWGDPMVSLGISVGFEVVQYNLVLICSGPMSWALRAAHEGCTLLDAWLWRG